MAPDIDAVTQLLRESKIWKAVAPYISNYDDFGFETRSNSPTSSYSLTHSRKRSRQEMEGGLNRKMN